MSCKRSISYSNSRTRYCALRSSLRSTLARRASEGESREEVSSLQNWQESCQFQPIRRAAYSLIELLIVISLISILAGIVLPRFEPGIHDQLQSAAQVVAADIAYARELAISNGSSYRLDFDPSNNRYVLRHSGSNALLDRLPRSPFGHPSETPDRRTTNLAELPYTGPPVALAAVERLAGSWQATAQIEFGSLGELTTPGNVRVWLRCGAGDQRRYIRVEVDAVTGLTSIDEYQAQPPATEVSL